MTTPILAGVTIKFSSYQYFRLACPGLSCAVTISTGSNLKGYVSLLIGLFVAKIGIDITAGFTRFTFGSVEMRGGVSFIPAMIGMFAISQVIRYPAAPGIGSAPPQQSVKNVFGGIGSTLRKYKLNVARGALIGADIGI